MLVANYSRAGSESKLEARRLGRAVALSELHQHLSASARPDRRAGRMMVDARVSRNDGDTANCTFRSASYASCGRRIPRCRSRSDPNERPFSTRPGEGFVSGVTLFGCGQQTFTEHY